MTRPEGRLASERPAGPVTPFHFGIGLLAKGALPARVSLAAGAGHAMLCWRWGRTR